MQLQWKSQWKWKFCGTEEFYRSWRLRSQCQNIREINEQLQMHGVSIEFIWKSAICPRFAPRQLQHFPSWDKCISICVVKFTICKFSHEKIIIWSFLTFFLKIPGFSFFFLMFFKTYLCFSKKIHIFLFKLLWPLFLLNIWNKKRCISCT